MSTLSKSNLIGRHTYKVTIFGFDLGVESMVVDNPNPFVHDALALRSVRPFWRQFCKVVWTKI